MQSYIDSISPEHLRGTECHGPNKLVTTRCNNVKRADDFNAPHAPKTLQFNKNAHGALDHFQFYIEKVDASH